MKFIINNTTMASIMKVASQVKKPESKIVLTLGGADAGENVICQLRITTDAEQASYNFSAVKPEDWDGSAIVTSVDATKFISIVESTLAFNEDIYLELMSTILEVGILGKVKTSLPIESQIPEEIKPLRFFYRFEIGCVELSNLLNKGCAFTKEVVDTRGIHNAVLKLMPPTDEIIGFSTDGNTVASTKVKASFTKKAETDAQKAMLEDMNAAVEEFCTQHTEQNKDAFNVVIPREAVQHLARFVEGQQKVAVFIDSRFMHVQIGGKALMYTIKQGGTQVSSIEQITALISAEENGKFCADSQALRNAISFINKNNAIAGSENEKLPTKLDIKEGEMLIARSGIQDKNEAAIKASAVVGNQFTAFNGKMLEAALAALNKGNIVVYAGSRHLALFNGTIDNIDRDSFVFIFQVNLAKKQEAEAEESAEVESAE